MPQSYDLGTASGRVVIEYDGKGVQQAAGDIDRLGSSAQKNNGSLTALATGMTMVGRTMALAGAVITGGFALAVSSAANFEHQMSAVQAVSGATSEEMAQISKAALRIGKDTVFSASEAGAAMEELAKQGIPVKDIINGAADATVALAAAGGTDLPTAARIAATALNQYKLKASDLTGVVDILAGAANASATDVTSMGEALSFVGPIANATGLSFKDTATMIALFANNGIDGMKAGTALRAMLSTLGSPTKEAAARMKDLGLITADGANILFDASGKIKPMAEVTAILRDHLAGLNQEQLLQFADATVGRDNMSALAAIVNTSAGDYDKLVAAIDRTSAADVAATRLDNFKGSVEQMRGSLETAGIAIGNILLPALRSIIDHARVVVDWFSNLSTGAQSIIVGFAAAGAAILLLGGGTLLIIGSLLRLRAALLLAAGATTIFGEAGALAGAKMKIVSAATAIWNAILDANPILRIVSIVLLLVGALITLAGGWDNVLAALRPLMDALKTAFEPIIPQVAALGATIAGVLGTALQAILPIFMTLAQAVLPVVIAIIQALVPILSVVGEILAAILGPALTIVGALFQALAPIIVVLLQALKPLIDLLLLILVPVLNVIVFALQLLADGLTWVAAQVVAFFTSTNGQVSQAQAVWDGFVAWLTGLWNGLVAFFQPTIQAIITNFTVLQIGVSAIWNAIMVVISAVVTWFSTFVVPIIQGVVNVIVAIFTFLWNTSQAIWNAVMAVVQGFLNWFNANVAPVIQAVINLIVKIFTFLWNTAQLIWNNIMNVVKAFLDWFNGNVAPVIQAAINLVVKIFNFLLSSAQAIWNNIFNVISTVVRNVTNFISSVWGSIVGIASGIFNSVFGVVSGIFNNIYGTVSSIVRNVVNFISSVWGTIVGIVGGIFNNVLSAIKGPMDQVVGFMNGIKDKVIGAFANAGAWLIDAGKKIIGGLINGLNSMLGGIKDVLNGITSMIPNVKGPPPKDKVLLTKNGRLIMQGLINGIKDEIPDLRKTLGTVTDIMPADLRNALSGTLSRGSSTTDARIFNYNAAAGSAQLDGSQELFMALKRAKVVVPGWH